MTKRWSKAEDDALRAFYADAGGVAVDLNTVASTLGRTRNGIACRANALGITSRNGACRESTRKLSSEASKRYLAENGHPRGMKGKRHSDEAKRKIAASGIGRKHPPRSAATRKRISENMRTRLAAQSAGNVYSRAKRGRRDDLGDAFFRSKWEANIARWLTFTGRRWEYEPTTFWFDKIKRGVRSYTPDFYLPDEDRYVEVKGWMDGKSFTKLKRMKKYHPKVRIELIDAKRYKEIAAAASEIPGWEK